MRAVIYNLVLLVAIAGYAQEAVDRPQVAWLNGHAEADELEIHLTGARLIGNVTIHLERVGESTATIDVIADRVTLITSTDETGRLAVKKLFAAGDVHIEAVDRNEAKGETYLVVCDCDRLYYLAAEEVVTLTSDGDNPIRGHLTQEVVPAPGSSVKEPQKLTIELTGRKQAKVYLKETDLEADWEPEGEG